MVHNAPSSQLPFHLLEIYSVNFVVMWTHKGLEFFALMPRFAFCETYGMGACFFVIAPNENAKAFCATYVT